MLLKEFLDLNYNSESYRVLIESVNLQCYFSKSRVPTSLLKYEVICWRADGDNLLLITIQKPTDGDIEKVLEKLL